MNRKLFSIIVIFLVATLILVACERPATRAVVPTKTKEGEIPFPVATQPQIMIDILKGTQTAAALTPQAGGGVGPTYTPSSGTGGVESTAVPKATATPIVYATSTPGKPSSYKLLAGEFPYCIARRFNVNPADLLSASGLDINSLPPVGYKLTIPTSGSFPGERALVSHPASYTVIAGDTIGKVACYYGDVDPNVIYAANGLKAGSELKVGQVLQIP